MAKVGSGVAVDDDPDAAGQPAGEGLRRIRRAQQEGFGRHQNIGHRAAVHMQFDRLIPAVAQDQGNGWKGHGNAGRGDQDVQEQQARHLVGLLGQCAHVPDDLGLGVEAGGGHIQASAAPVLFGHGAQQGFVHIVDHQLSQRLGAEHAGPEQNAEAAGPQQAFGSAVSEGPGQPGVALFADKGEGRDQGAGADAGDDFEFRSVTALAPAVQHARPEGAVGPAAGQGQQIDRSVFGGPGRDAQFAHKAQLSLLDIEIVADGGAGGAQLGRGDIQARIGLAGGRQHQQDAARDDAAQTRHDPSPCPAGRLRPRAGCDNPLCPISRGAVRGSMAGEADVTSWLVLECSDMWPHHPGWLARRPSPPWTPLRG